MNLSSIKSHLRPYSIVQKRTTTINHAFASGLAPFDDYDRDRVSEAMNHLGQKDEGDLRCVYCESAAETWDHLVGLVKNSEFSGYGHQIGNLVPCCRECNSEKGGKKWDVFLRNKCQDDDRFERIKSTLTQYLDHFAKKVDVPREREDNPEKWSRYDKIKDEILELMAEADELAKDLRLQVRQPKPHLNEKQGSLHHRTDSSEKQP